MPIHPTRYSRVSIGWLTSTKSLVDQDPADTGEVFDTMGDAVFRSAVSIGGAVTLSGAQTQLSTASYGGNVTASSGIFVGNAAAINEIVAISSVTTGPTFGAIGVSGGVSLVTVAMSGATRGDTILVTADSKWQQVAAHRYVWLQASSGSTTGEVNVWATNSGLTAVTPTAGVVLRLIRFNHPSYV